MKSAAVAVVVIPVTILLAFCTPAPCVQVRSTWFAAPDGTGMACTQSDPCALSEASALAAAGATIYLESGTYTAAALATEVFKAYNSLTFLGGWDGTTTTPPVRSNNMLGTTIDGQNSVRGVMIHGPGITVTFDNLTFWRGSSTDRGGAVWVSEANLILRRVVFWENFVSATAYNNLDFGGGGVYIEGGRLNVANSYFLGNGAVNTNGYETYGGAILLKDATRAVVKGTAFGGNDARNGSAIGMRALVDGAPLTPVVIQRCIFAENGLNNSTAGLGDYGGGVYLERAAAEISASTFTGNAVTEAGGAVFQRYGTLHMDRNTVTENSAGGRGIIHIFYGDGLLRNNIIADNLPGADAGAAAVYLVRPSVDVTLTHNTIVGPSAGHRGSGVAGFNDSRAVLLNNILARLDEGVYAWQGADISLKGTLWGDGAWGNALNYNKDALPSSTVTELAGNRTGDPRFLDPTVAGAWRIGPLSAARNEALPSAVTLDVDGEPRGGNPDIGADEYMTRVLLVAPNGGQSLAEEGSVVVRWGAPVAAVKFKLSYSLNGGATWRLIADDVTGRSHIWNLPAVDVTRAQCLVRVIGYDALDAVFGSDRSDAVFTIRNLD